jgi:hypothetical protein
MKTNMLHAVRRIMNLNSPNSMDIGPYFSVCVVGRGILIGPSPTQKSLPYTKKISILSEMNSVFEHTRKCKSKRGMSRKSRRGDNDDHYDDGQEELMCSLYLEQLIFRRPRNSLLSWIQHCVQDDSM